MIFAILTTNVGQKPLREQDLQAQQQYLEDLAESGVLLAAGPFDDQIGGMTLINATSVEEAIAVARADPLVKAGLERYQVRSWSRVFDPERRLVLQHSSPNQVGPTSGIEHSPLEMPPSEENFTIIEATDDPAYEEFLVRCFSPKQIQADDTVRKNYLDLAKNNGWRKLLLLHEDTVAGQIEFATTQVCGLPIKGTNITIVHCLWILDAFTGLDGSRRLLAACADASHGSQGLATIAYNSTLGWLPRSLFEAHGFATIDQLETGRFCGDTPIAAYLMWRPLQEDVEPPTWDRDQLLAGVDFCPAYPWMFGRRRYWGRDYPYRARLVVEGLRRPEVLQQFPKLAQRQAGHWTLVELGVPAEDLNRAAERLQGALISEPTYYAYIYGVDTHRDELIIIYPFREYRVTKDERSWAEALRYGLDKKIPREDLVFETTPLEQPTD